MRSLIALSALALVLGCGQPAEQTEPTAEPEAVAPAPAPPAVVVLTEADARTRIEGAGYTNVTALTQGADGRWTATATQNGSSVNVAIDDQGNVSLVTATP
jgi:putative membrane protein